MVNVYLDSQPNSFGGSPVTAATNISVFVTVYGDTTNDISGIPTILSGTTSVSNYYTNFLPNETIIDVTVDAISPNPPTTKQTYNFGGTTFSGSCN